MDWQDFVGKTIKSVSERKLTNYDDEVVDIEFTDGSGATISGYYWNYTGYSIGEYPTDVSIHEFGWEPSKDDEDEDEE